MTISFLFTRRAALETWKQRLGPNATYNNLIGVFERAGYQGYASTVRDIFGMYHQIVSYVYIPQQPVLQESPSPLLLCSALKSNLYSLGRHSADVDDVRPPPTKKPKPQGMCAVI